MNKCVFEDAGSQLTFRIQNINNSGLATNFILALSIFFIVNPVLAFIFLDIELTFGLFLVCLFSWLISVYFLRLYLWNKFGEEVFLFESNRVEVFNDYKLFKDNRRAHSFNEIDICFLCDNKQVSASTFGNDKSCLNNESIVVIQGDEFTLSSFQKVRIEDILMLNEFVHHNGIR